ncbi:YceI family protein [Parasediminibacterium sp. JCM 36343]|uniref:YceI family protein n=1 Tax=Parasediminibacterium sp. JCM 36343 TaxID=3374279 RepID=UPI00397BE9DF
MIKKLILIASFFLAFTIALQAQKLYSTKSAQVKFASSTAAEDIEATNNQAESKLTDKGQIMFSLLIKGFKFENELMQEHFNGKEYMQSDVYPKAEFKGTIVNIATVNFAKDGAYPVMVDGNLTIRGVTQKTKAAGLVVIEKGKVNTKSTFKIKLNDYGIKGKDIGSVIAAAVEITVAAKYE